MSFSIALALLAGAAQAWADDIYAPPWRGDEGSTYQQWTFDDSDNPAVPEVDNNPYGTAVASLVGDGVNTWSPMWYSLQFQRVGVWTGLASADLWVPNRPESDVYKEIWVQATYFVTDPSTAAPTVNVPGATYLGGEVIELEHLDSYHWELQLTTWRLEPNPDEETIVLTWPVVVPTSGYGWLDQVVVDTVCIPEPATLSLLCGAAVALLLKRRPRA